MRPQPLVQVQIVGAILLLLTFLPGVSELTAQTSSADSTAGLSRAREAQSRFERTRARHLPRTLHRGGGRCDDAVGRMCWRHVEGDLWLPDPEKIEVVEARELLLIELSLIADQIPGDDWVLGQRVWYLGEFGRWEQAFGVVDDGCLGTPWWCDALRGLVLHQLGRYWDAEAEYRSALAAMDEEARAAWLDLSALVERDARSILREDDLATPLLWAWADPLYLMSGNDRRTEHFARHTVARIRERAQNPYRMAWGDDMAELMIRYGWAIGWESIRDPIAPIGGEEHVVGHEHPDGRTYLPPAKLLKAALDIEGVEEEEPWSPTFRFAPTAYAPAYAPRVLPMTSTLHRFPRKDSVIFVATWTLPTDTTLRESRGRSLPFSRHPMAPAGQLLHGVFGLPFESLSVDGQWDEARQARISGTSVETGRGVERLAVSAGRHLVSIEAWKPDHGIAGRYRVVVDAQPTLPGIATISDVIFLDPSREPETLDDALRFVVPTAVFEAGEQLRVAWEVTGLGLRPEKLEYSVSLGRVEGGFFRAVGRTLGLVGSDAEDRLIWSESGPDTTAPHFRTLLVDLPRVEEGEYTLRVRLSLDGRTPVVTERTLRVVRPSVDENPRHF